MASSADQADMAMTDTAEPRPKAPHTRKHHAKAFKNRELFSCTIRRPPFAYAQVRVVDKAGTDTLAVPLDALLVRSYCDKALRRFLGTTGAAMPLDLLRLDGNTFWVRVPREDLGLFAAALAAWTQAAGGSSSASLSSPPVVLRLQTAGNWLGSLVGRTEEQALWDDT